VLAVGIYDRLVQQSAAIVDLRRDNPRGGLGSPAGSAVTVAASGAEARTAGSGGCPADAATGHGNTDTPAPGPGLAQAPDTRTADQVRADLLADLLLTAAPDADPTRSDDGPGALGAIRARVQVVVPALTMLR
ncbi:hypothetical protein QM517_18080, partial [Rhodococcus sp. IEGM 1404]|nr:hypothetical protein [Microbacterium sp. IEGM 1404]